MSAVWKYTPQERALDNLYAALCTCRDLRLEADRHPINSSASHMPLVEREGYKSDAKARVYEIRAHGWKLTPLLIDMLRAEGVAT